MSEQAGRHERPFDAAEFARQTVRTIEMGDAYASVLERRVIAVEQCIASPWYRRWLLWRRLRREIRASVAGWDPAYIRPGDFYARRLEAATQEAEELLAGEHRAWGERQAADDAGRQDPGEGFLP